MNLEERIARLEARVGIQELIARYCFTIDARDTEGIGACFTDSGTFRSFDGAMNASGRDAVVQQFHDRFAVLGPSNHFTHDQVITFDELDGNHATGLVNAHAEVVRNDAALWTSLRYHDDYRRDGGCWRFQTRILEFFYYLRAAEYADAMLGTLRNRADAEPRAADYPENVPTWVAYYESHPRP